MHGQQTLPLFLILAYDTDQEHFKEQEDGNLLHRTQLPTEYSLPFIHEGNYIKVHRQLNCFILYLKESKQQLSTPSQYFSKSFPN